MAGPEFEIEISAAGQVRVTVRGAPGKECLKYADLLGEIVGREQQRQLTAEYYAPDGQVRIDTHVEGRVTR